MLKKNTETKPLVNQRTNHPPLEEEEVYFESYDGSQDVNVWATRFLDEYGSQPWDGYDRNEYLYFHVGVTKLFSAVVHKQLGQTTFQTLINCMVEFTVGGNLPGYINVFYQKATYAAFLQDHKEKRNSPSALDVVTKHFHVAVNELWEEGINMPIRDVEDMKQLVHHIELFRDMKLPSGIKEIYIRKLTQKLEVNKTFRVTPAHELGNARTFTKLASLISEEILYFARSKPIQQEPVYVTTYQPKTSPQMIAPNQCYTCGQQGHIAKYCDQYLYEQSYDDDSHGDQRVDDQPPQGSSKHCYNCGQQGHIARNCDKYLDDESCDDGNHGNRRMDDDQPPQGSSKPPRNSSKQCYKCGQQGHIARHCDRDSDQQSDDDSMYDDQPPQGSSRQCYYGDQPPQGSSKHCYNCGQQGHIARYCDKDYGNESYDSRNHDNQRMEVAQPQDSSKRCYNCGQQGHISRNCLQHSDQQSDDDDSMYDDQPPQGSSRQCYYGDQPPQGSSKQCYNCGQRGHLARNCQNAYEQSSDDDSMYDDQPSQYSSRQCYYCSEWGHISQYCERRKYDQQR